MATPTTGLSMTKEDEESVKKRVEEFNIVSKYINLGYMDGDYITKRLVELSLKFDKADDIMHASKSGSEEQDEDQLKMNKTAGQMKDKDSANKWLNQLHDIQFDLEFFQCRGDFTPFLSESEEEDEEIQDEVKPKGELKERFLAKLTESDSFDEDEDWIFSGEGYNDFDGEFYTNIEGLKDDMRGMMFQGQNKS